MDILLGLSTLAAASILLSFAYGAHRRPVAAKWTQIPGLSMLVCVALTLMGPVGLGFLLKAVASPMAEFASLGAMSVAVTAALVTVAMLSCPFLIRSALIKGAWMDAPIAHNRNVAPSVDSVIAA